jgi:hypothetical protein
MRNERAEITARPAALQDYRVVRITKGAALAAHRK